MATSALSRPTAAGIGAALAVAVVLGAAVGVATSYGQAELAYPWAALVNAASPWLLVAFLVGLVPRRLAAAAGAGLLGCVAADVGYYVTTAARGFAVSTTEIVFWTVCAVVGGPLFGAAAFTWWRDADGRRRAIGAAFLPATFLGEAVGTYALRLHYAGSAVLFALVGVACALVVAGVPRTRRVRLPDFVVAVVVLGVLGALAYGFVLHVAGGLAFG